MNAKKPASYKYDLSWLTFAKAFWNGKRLATIVAVVSAAAAIAVIHSLPAIYKADALVLVDTQKIPERFVSTTVTAEVQDRLNTISQEILSSTRLSRIIADFGLYEKERRKLTREEVIEIMRKDLDVKVEKPGGGNRPGAFRISYQSSDPIMVAKVANRIADLYIEENLRSREVQAEGTSEFIENQLKEAKRQLDQLEASVSQYKIQHNGELPQQENSISSTLSRLQTELVGAQDSINRAEQSKILLQNGLAAAEQVQASLTAALRPPAASPSVTGEPSTAFSVRVSPPSRADQLAAQLQTLRTRYSDEHPEVKYVLRELDQARAAERHQAAPVKAEGGNGASVKAEHVPVSADPLIVGQLLSAKERTAGLRAQLAALDREIEGRQTDRKRILSEIGLYQSRVNRLPLREQEMASLTRDYEMSKLNYRSLLDKKIAAEMAGDLERRQKAEKFTVIDPARIPEKPSKPNRPVLYIAAIIGSLALGIASAITRNLLPDTLLGEWELPKDVPVLGRVPRIDLMTPAVSNNPNRKFQARWWRAS
jgi:polysaccharide biosynthesis transport protein